VQAAQAALLPALAQCYATRLVGNVVSGMVSTAAAALALVEQSLPPVRTTATTAVSALI